MKMAEAGAPYLDVLECLNRALRGAAVPGFMGRHRALARLEEFAELVAGRAGRPLP